MKFYIECFKISHDVLINFESHDLHRRQVATTHLSWDNLSTILPFSVMQMSISFRKWKINGTLCLLSAISLPSSRNCRHALILLLPGNIRSDVGSSRCFESISQLKSKCQHLPSYLVKNFAAPCQQTNNSTKRHWIVGAHVRVHNVFCYPCVFLPSWILEKKVFPLS